MNNFIGFCHVCNFFLNFRKFNVWIKRFIGKLRPIHAPKIRSSNIKHRHIDSFIERKHWHRNFGKFDGFGFRLCTHILERNRIVCHIPNIHFYLTYFFANLPGDARRFQKCWTLCRFVWYNAHGTHLYPLHAHVGWMFARTLPPIASAVHELPRSVLQRVSNRSARIAEIFEYCKVHFKSVLFV